MGFELICYLNFGYPDIETGIRAACTYVECGCTALQLDIPSRDPYLEHLAIQKRMRYCLEHTPNYDDYFEGIAKIRHLYPELRLVFMLYENTVREVGVSKITSFCKENRIELSTYVGSDERVKQALIDGGLNIACYVQFHLPQDEVEFALASTMPTLLQMRPAGEIRPGYDTFEKCLAYLRRAGVSGPVYASVGIREPQDVRMVKRAHADGAFIGSVLMNVIDDEAKLKETIAQFTAAANQ